MKNNKNYSITGGAGRMGEDLGASYKKVITLYWVI